MIKNAILNICNQLQNTSTFPSKNTAVANNAWQSIMSHRNVDWVLWQHKKVFRDAFLVRKFWYFDSSFTEVCSKSFHNQYVSIGLDNALMLNS